MLTAGGRFVKTYNMPDFKKIQQETNDSQTVYNQIIDRIYLANVNTSNPFGLSLFNYWEFLNGDGESISLKPKSLEQYHPGLGSFSFLPKIGIVNCTLDYYLTGKILYNQQPSLEITSVNGLNPETIGKKIKEQNSRIVNAGE